MFNFTLYRYFKYTCFFLCFCAFQTAYADTNSSCSQAFTPSSIDEFVSAMTKNAHLHKHQGKLFELYRNNGFGNPNYNTRGNTLQEVFHFTEKHPELFKMPVREQIISFEQQFAEKDENLNKLLKQLKRIHLSKMQNLFQIESSLNFWNYILAFRKPASSTGLTRTQRKELKQQHHQEFLSYLNDFIDKDTREYISNTSLSYPAKIIVLYNTLKKAREKLKKSNKNIHPISQAMVDLIAGSGFLNEYYLHLLNSSNAITAIEGLKKIIEERETITAALGFSGGFSEFKENLGIPPIKQNTPQDLLFEKIENEILNIKAQLENTGNLKEQIQMFRLRALSLQESPFRSCLGGDCTTANFFEIGLHPNFLFFTLTDNQHRSSGQITIVLGFAKDREGQSIKTAIVDNIHNVPTEKIYPMLEGIRLSLSEYGYRLAFPNREDLSNEQVIREYVRSEIVPDLKLNLNFFKPHETQFPLDKYYINYNLLIDAVEFEGSSARKDSGLAIAPDQKYFSTNINEDLNLRHFEPEFLNLRGSKKEEDQMRFLNNLPLFMTSLLKTSTRELIINHLLILLQQGSFFVRKYSLYSLIHFSYRITALRDLDTYLKYFTKKERKSILDEMSLWKKAENNNRQERDFIHKIQNHLSSFDENVDQLKEELVSQQYWKLLDMDFIFDSMMRKNTPDIINFFLEEVGIDINNPKKLYLHRAAHYDINAVKILLERGADINIKDTTGSTALHWASMYGHTSRVRLFLEYGADPNIENSKGMKPLEFAVSGEHMDIVNILVEYETRNFPSNPWLIDEGISLGNFLGTGNAPHGTIEWMSFEEAKALVQGIGFVSVRQFYEWSRSEQRPRNFPSNPRRGYEDEWKGWRDFLGF